MRDDSRIPYLHEWHGYKGRFTREQAAGAIPNGERIIKRGSVETDCVQDGSIGIVVGSIDVSDVAPILAARYPCKYLYFVEWNDLPMVVNATRDFKIGKLS